MVARLLVVDDHNLVRHGIVKMLESQANFEVVGQASNGYDAVNKAGELNVDAVVMDLYMPGLDGIAATRLIKKELPDVQVVIVTASEDDADLFEAIQAGARGYVLKSVDEKVFIQQLNHVLSGNVGMTEDMTTKLVTALAHKGSDSLSSSRTEYEPLTEREKEVLALISKGATNKEIGSTLFISENTVRAHVRTLMQKLQMENRTQLAVFGVHEGYTVAGRNNVPGNGAENTRRFSSAYAG